MGDGLLRLIFPLERGGIPLERGGSTSWGAAIVPRGVFHTAAGGCAMISIIDCDTGVDLDVFLGTWVLSGVAGTWASPGGRLLAAHLECGRFFGVFCQCVKVDIDCQVESV